MDGQEKVTHVVVDSGAFIKNASIQTIGEKLYTLSDVVSEIRDRATRERLQVLPYTLLYREPSAQAIKFVTDFAKKTGDYRSLSATDLRLIALTYQLETEFGDKESVRQTPSRQSELVTARKLLENPAQIAGFYLSDKHKKNSSKTKVAENIVESSNTKQEDCDEPASVDEVVLKPLEELGIRDSSESVEKRLSTSTSEELQNETNNAEIHKALKSEEDCSSSSKFLDGDTLESDLLGASESEDDDSEAGDDSVDDDDDDDGGWITPSNIRSVREQMGDVNTEKATVAVGCLTTDFAMQNVLIQMGLHVISVNGMLIKRVKSYALRCFACMKVSSNLTKQFCPHCGNNTLQKVSMTVDENGAVRYFLSHRKATSTRGLKYSLPTPKGGKHATNPVLCEDQPLPQQREPKKAQHGLNVFDPDYVANQSPFAINDTTSRAAQLGIRGQRGGWNKRNPNTGRKKSGRKK